MGEAALPRYETNIEAWKAALARDGNPDNEPLNKYGIYSTKQTRDEPPQIWVNKRWATVKVDNSDRPWVLVPLIRGLKQED